MPLPRIGWPVQNALLCGIIGLMALCPLGAFAYVLRTDILPILGLID